MFYVSLSGTAAYVLNVAADNSRNENSGKLAISE
jgi:hypothetical protein